MRWYCQEHPDVELCSTTGNSECFKCKDEKETREQWKTLKFEHGQYRLILIEIAEEDCVHWEDQTCQEESPNDQSEWCIPCKADNVIGPYRSGDEKLKRRKQNNE